MAHSLSLSSCLLAIFASHASAQDDRAPTRDQVSIQERAGFMEAVNRIATGDERGGMQALEEITARFGNDPDLFIAHYNLACGHARLKEIDAAFASLARAIELGYAIDPGQLANLQRDPDLAALRADPRFEKALAGAKRRDEELAAQLPALLKPFHWMPPSPAGSPGAPPPLLIVLHPFGAEREAFARTNYLDFCRKNGFALLAPSGEFFLSPGHFSWFRGEGDFIDRFRRAARRVWFALEEFRKESAIDPQRVYVTGLGEGAALGFALAVRNPQWVRGAVLFGGGYSPAALEEWQKTAARWGRRIALVHGKGDDVYPLAPLTPFVDDLRKQGLALELSTIDAGHDLPGPQLLEPLLLEKLKWIDGTPFTPPSPPKPGDPAPAKAGGN